MIDISDSPINNRDLRIISWVLSSLNRHPSGNRDEFIRDFSNSLLEVIANGKKETIRRIKESIKYNEKEG